MKILPADSEHSALFQCIQGMPEGALRRIILTASGGAFRDMELSTMKELAISDPTALHKKATTHPNWDMGAKITIDSASMMNKGLEVIEAKWLFGLKQDLQIYQKLLSSERLVKSQTIPLSQFLNEGDIVEFGNSKLKILYTPGHAPGHISLYSKEEKFIISGDVLFKSSIGRTDLPGGDFNVLIESIKTKILCLDDDTVVYCGHGPTTTVGYERANNPFLK